MNNGTKKAKWTKKLKALIISVGVAFAVALGGACAAIGVSLSGGNRKFGGSMAGSASGTTDEKPAATFRLGDEEGADGTLYTYKTQAEAWAKAVEYSLAHDSALVQFDLVSTWKATAPVVTTTTTGEGDAATTTTTVTSYGGFGTAATNEDGTLAENSAFTTAGALRIPANAQIILNIPSERVKLDRNIGATAVPDGEVINVAGRLIYQGSGTITGGNTQGSGGGINALGTAKLEIYSGNISGNIAQIDGGGIYSNCKLEMHGGTISENKALRPYETVGGGGGIYVNNSAVIDGGTITRNTSVSRGGGLIVHTAATIENVFISENNCDNFGGGAFLWSSGTYEIGEGTQILNNTARWGGGIFPSTNSTLNMTAGTVDGNTATQYGGGICVYDGATLTSNGTQFTNNKASDGGAVYMRKSEGEIPATKATVSNAKFLNNITTGSGAGVYVSPTSTAEFNNCTFTGNEAGTNGGGIGMKKGAMVYVDGCTFTENKAYNETGGGIDIESLYASTAGHPIAGLLEVHRSTFNNNWAKHEGGAINSRAHSYMVIGTENDPTDVNTFTGNESVYGGAIRTQHIHVYNAVFENSIATEDGGAIRVVNMSEKALETVNGEEVETSPVNYFIGCTFRNNIARYGGGISTFNWMMVYSTNNIITGCNFENNTATGSGGGVWISNTGISAAITSCTFTGNSAAVNGGGFYASVAPNADEGNRVTVSDCTITNNTADNAGGGVFANHFTYSYTPSGSTTAVASTQPTEITIANTEISGNKTSGNGGGYFVTGNSKGTFNVNNCEIVNNIADANGGGILLNIGGATLNLNAGEISGNTSRHGGGIYVQTGSKIVNVGTTRTAIKGNGASVGGGGVFVSSPITLENVTIDGGNYAPKGGGVLVGATTTISGTINITGNYVAKFDTTSNTFVADTSRKNNWHQDTNGYLAIGSNISSSTNIGFSTSSLNATTTSSALGVKLSTAAVTNFSRSADDSNYVLSNGSSGFLLYRNMSGPSSAYQTSLWQGAINQSLNNHGAVQTVSLYADWTATAGGSYGTYFGTGPSDLNDYSKAYTPYGALNVPAGANIILDLNGHTLNRNLTATYSGGHVIVVNGTLTITGGGTIKGGNTGKGGGINVGGGTLILNGGTITGNTAVNEGGGGVVVDGGKFIMNGGTITANTAISAGQGVRLTDGSTFIMNGGTISNHTANGYSGVFVTGANATFTMNSGVISGNSAKAHNGGGVRLELGASFTMNGGIISGNNSPDYGGGGVFVQNSSTFTMNGGTISGNVASSGTRVDGGGGVSVYNKSTFNMNGGTITNNTALYGGGVVITSNSTMNLGANNNGTYSGNGRIISNQCAAGSSRGAGVYVLNGTLNMYAGTIANNGYTTAANGTVTVNAGFGGGIDCRGGTVNIYGGKISGNRATNGGAIYATIPDASVPEETDFTKNQPTINVSGGEISGNIASTGGGIYMLGKLNVSGGEIKNNSATYGGGIAFGHCGSFVLEGNALISGNTATANGGGISVNLGLASFASTFVMRGNAKIVNNKANFGGGAYITGNVGTFTISGGEISGNSVTLNTEETGGNGAGVYVNGSALTVSGGKIYKNTAAVSGGGLYVAAGTTTISGGEIYGNSSKSHGGGVSVGDGANLKLSGGDIYENSADGYGAGIYTTNNTNFEMSGGRIFRNKAKNGNSGILIHAASDPKSGTFTMTGGEIFGNLSDTQCAGMGVVGIAVISGGKIYNNYAKNGGGAIGMSGTESSVTITGTAEIYNNEAKNGGALFAYAGKFIVSGGKIYNNYATNGGAIRIETNKTSLEISGGEIYDNTAESYGGAVYIDTGATCTMSNGVISGNEAGGYGGGIYTAESSTLTISGGEISGNYANSHGGGMYTYGTVTIRGGKISGNTAKFNGAGVYVSNGALTMSDGEISGNSTINHAGAVFVYRGTFTMTGGEITGNTINHAGGGVYIRAQGTFNMSGGEISGNTAKGIDGLTGDKSDNAGGGVYVAGTFATRGNPVITGNKSGDKLNNVYLPDEKKITVSGAFGASAEIGVTVGNITADNITAEQSAVAFTGGYGENHSNGNAVSRVFRPDDSHLIAYPLDTGNTTEAALNSAHNLTIDVYEFGATSPASSAVIRVDGNTSVTYTLAPDKKSFTFTSYQGNTQLPTVVSVPTPAGYTPYICNQTGSEIASGAGVLGNMSADRTLHVAYRADNDTAYTVYYILQQAEAVDGYTDRDGYLLATDPAELNGEESVYIYTGRGTTDGALKYIGDDNKALYAGETAWTDWDHYTFYSVNANNDTIQNASRPTVNGDGSSYVLVYLKRNEYRVTFSAAGATNVERARTLRFGATITKPTRNPVKPSSTFKHWSATRDGAAFDFENSKVTGDITLYAVFEVKQYKVTFNLNIGSEYNGSDTDNRLPADNRFKVVIVDGYNLLSGIVNWNVDSLFDESFKFTPEVDGNEAETGRYDITYTVDNLTTNKRISGIVPTAVGYTFEGWYTDIYNENANPTEVIRVPNNNTQDIELTAKWSRTPYTIRLDAQNGTRVTTEPFANLTAWNSILPETNPVKTGNKFVGWRVTTDTNSDNYVSLDDFSRSADSNGVAVFSIADFVAAGLTDASRGYTVTLYAIWDPLPVSIRVAESEKGTLSFIKDSATLGDNAKVYVGDEITVNVSENAGYKFKNLQFTLPDGRLQTLRDLVVTFTVTTDLINTAGGDNPEYYISVDAVYTEQRFTIRYELDGGRSADGTFARSYSPSEMLATSSNRAKLPSLITKNGYDFDGWIYASTESSGRLVYAHATLPEGESYLGAELYLTKPTSDFEYRNIILKATWRAQASTVYLYNATYPTPVYNQPEGTNYFRIVQDDEGGTLVTGSEINIISPERDSFMFLGWATTRNGSVVYPATEYDENDRALPISYTVNADHDTDGNPLNRNNLYAVWHVKGVNYIIMSATNNECTYGGDGIKMSARPAQEYTNNDAQITLFYRWYKVFNGMYDECFTVTDYVDNNGFKWYLDEGDNIVCYEKDGKYYETDKTTEIPEPIGTKFTVKDFNPESIGTACEAKFVREISAAEQTKEVTVVNVADCGTYICVVDVVASDDSGSTTRQKGYGEIEISMNKAAYNNLVLETREDVVYNSEEQWNQVMLGYAASQTGLVLPQNSEDGLLTLPDGSKAIVTYTYYKGAGELIDGVAREQITDLSQIKNVGEYHVVVSFEWAVGGDKGNYEPLATLEADLYIVAKQITSVTPEFTKDGVKSELDFSGTYDGSSYGVNFVINDRMTVNNSTTLVTDIDDVEIDVKVVRVTDNGDEDVNSENLPTTEAGTYAVIIQGLKGESAGNYILGNNVTLRKQYTIGKKKYEVADHIHFNDDDTPVYDGKPHTISISFDDGYSLPEFVSATYTTEYVPEDGGFSTSKKVANGGVDAGIYAVTVTFSFTDSATENNYEKLADMTATLTINKADFFDFHNVDGRDLLRDSGFVSRSYGYQTTAHYNPYVNNNFGCGASDLSIRYSYYTVDTATQTRTLIEGADNKTHDELVAADNALIEAHNPGFISAAGKYEIVAHLTYESAEFRNNFADAAESKTTITYEIEGRNIVRVSVAAWADDFDMKVKLGDAFDYSWIKQINVVYEGDAGTLEITRPEDIELAGIDFGTKSGAAQNKFWHVGEFGLNVSYYQVSSESYTFNVYEEVTQVTVRYRIGTEGGYTNTVTADGLPLLTEGEYNFEISYQGTNAEGNAEQMTKYATISGTPALGSENVLSVADAGYYEFGDIKIALYGVLTDVSWQYSLDGNAWNDVPENGSLVYAGKKYLFRAVKGGMTFEAHTQSGLDVLNVANYIIEVGRSGNYLIDDDNAIAITKKTLGFRWNSDAFEYDMLSHVPSITESGVEEADKELVNFIFNYTDGNDNPILTTQDIVAVGSYKVTVSLGNSLAAGNYTVEGAENATFTFRIVKADIKTNEVYYSESNYGKNITYAGNGELRLSAMKVDFGENPSVAGTFKFVDGNNEEMDGTDYKDALKRNGTVFVRFIYEPNNQNYNDLIGTVAIEVKEPNKKTGEGALSVEFGRDAIEFYLLEDRIDTHDINVYQLYESTYQENGKWYGARELVTNPVFRIKGYNGTLESYRVNANDVSSGKIVLIARVTGSSNSGEIDLLVIDKTPTGMEIANAGEFRTKYYVGETPDFRDIEFRLLFGDNIKPAEGLKVPSIKTNFNRELTNSDDKFTVTFRYANVNVSYEFEALPKENLQIGTPTNKVLTYTGEKIAVPELTFRVDTDYDGQIEEIGQNDLEGVSVRVFVYKVGEAGLKDLLDEGEYTIRYEITSTNPRFNAPDPVIFTVTVTTNPYRVTIDVPEGNELRTPYTGDPIDIPTPTVSNIVDTRDENAFVNAVITYRIDDGKNTPVETESLTDSAWRKTNAGNYKVTVQVKVDGKVINETTEYTFVIEQAINSSIGLVVHPIVLGDGADFKFDIAADFGLETAKYEYSKDGTNFSATLPNEAGRWYVRVTIEETDNYTGAVETKQFEVRVNTTEAEKGEGFVDGSVEGGDGVGSGWQLVITDSDVSGESISKQTVMGGYNVVLKDEGGTTVKPENAYTVRIKLNEELSGRNDLNVFFKNAEGKLSKLDASVEDGYIVFSTSDFAGSFIITTEVPGEPIGLLVAVIVLGVIAAGMIAACIIVFVKKKKRGAE